MKIMTYNIQHCYNYLLKEVNFELLSSEIKRENPDIIGLNEVYGEDDSSFYGDQVTKIANMIGYEYYYFAKAFDHEKGPYGNALLSKIPITSVETIVIFEPEVKANPLGYYETRCLLVAELADGNRIIVTHFGLNEDEIEKEVDILKKYLRKDKCILVGDFNTTFNNNLLNPIKDYLYDASKNYCQDDFTFASYKPEVKIDYIFVSYDINVKNAYVVKKIVSDHFAHVAIIDN